MLDSSLFLVCSDPNIWVFDHLFSDVLIGHVNTLCDTTQVSEVHQEARGHRQRRSVRGWPLRPEAQTQEFFDVISRLVGVRLTEEFQSAMLTEVRGENQKPHMDGVELSDVERRYQQCDFLDETKQSVLDMHTVAVVPTLSVVVYFNDVGAIHFPQASSGEGVLIQGRRGRVVVIENYLDTARPHHNASAMHYGTYFEDAPKRLVTMGVLANSTPSQKKTPPYGLLYCPATLDAVFTLHDAHANMREYYDKQDREKKEKLIVSMSVSREGDELHAVGTDVGGTKLCDVPFELTTTEADLVHTMKSMLKRDDRYELEFLAPGGEVMSDKTRQVSSIPSFLDEVLGVLVSDSVVRLMVDGKIDYIKAAWQFVISVDRWVLGTVVLEISGGAFPTMSELRVSIRNRWAPSGNFVLVSTRGESLEGVDRLEGLFAGPQTMDLAVFSEDRLCITFEVQGLAHEAFLEHPDRLAQLRSVVSEHVGFETAVDVQKGTRLSETKLTLVTAVVFAGRASKRTKFEYMMYKTKELFQEAMLNGLQDLGWACDGRKLFVSFGTVEVVHAASGTS